MIAHHRRAGMILVPLLLLCLSIAAHAQFGQCDTCYRHYRYDSTLRFGAHLVNNARVAVDELTLDYGQYYGKSFHELANQIRSTGTNWTDIWNHKFFDTVDQKSFKTIFVPLRTDRVMDNAIMVENYFGKDCRPDCDNKPVGWDMATLHAYDLWLNRTNGLATDPLWHGKIWGYTVPSSDTAVLVGGGPRFAAHVTPRAVVQLWEDLYGTPLPSSKDSSRYLSLTLSLKVDPAYLDTLDDPVAIAKIILYKRYLNGQGDPNQSVKAHCMCDIFQPFDTIYITRSMYAAASTLTLQSSTKGVSPTAYRDVVATLFKWDATTLPPSGWNGIPTDGWYGNASPDTACVSYCRDSILPHAPAGSFAEDLPESDLNFRVYSTGVVPITVLRTRVARYGFEKLKRNELDSYLAADIDTALAVPKLKKMLWKISPDDEPEVEQFRALGLVSDALQRSMHARGDTNRGVWVNAIKNYDGLELLSQDADVEGLKLIHTLAPQSYADGGAVPVTYANPDSMDPAALTTFYQPSEGPDTVIGPYSDPTTKVIDRSRTMSMPRPKGIRFNTLSEYNDYTADRQREYGKFAVSGTVAGVTSGYFVEYAARAVDVARFKYRAFGVPPMPVHPVVRVHGVIQTELGPDSLPYFVRPLWVNVPTPEEITCRTWLAMNCGANGVVFSDFIYDGYNFGVMETFTGAHSAEYDTLRHPKPDEYNRNPSGLTTPKIWIGFRSRFDAVQRVIAELRRLDTVIGWRRLDYRGEQMSLHDTTQRFITMPLLDTVFTRMAKLRDTTSGGEYVDSAGVDPRSQTYMEVTHFRPGTGDTNTTSRYCLFTNRRTWPNDQNHYGTLARNAGAAEYGLGFIDVRRPVVRFKNSGPTLVDSFLVVKVGHESQWPSRKVKAGDTMQLDWIEPGWGALYRVTPIRQGVSALGTAYNNAVRSVNISDSVRRGQVIVYERDSIVYAQTMDAAGNWSEEFRISDTVDAGASRQAWTVNPAIAPVRNGTSWLFVWERINVSTGASTIRARYFANFPHPDSLTTSKVLTLGTSRTVASPYRMTPAVTGLDSGYVVSWASPSYGIESVAITDVANPSGSVSPVLVSKMGPPWIAVDSLCQFPTLASRREFKDTHHRVHLAWQQSGAVGTGILYMPLLVRFPVGSKPQLTNGLLVPEVVNIGLPGCHFQHPSIAVDSIRLGVAFQMIVSAYLSTSPFAPSATGTVSVVVLRFRDSAGVFRGTPWKTRSYYWGNDAAYFEWPSLTHFPASTIDAHVGPGGAPQGALAWHRIRSSKGLYQQFLFRYGLPSMDTLPSGLYPGMTLVPLRRTAPFLEYSSVFHRDRTPQSFNAAGPLGVGTRTYYDAMLANHPSRTNSLFQGVGAVGRPVSLQTTLKSVRYALGDLCYHPTFITGIIIGGTHGQYPRDGLTDGPDLPPSYFAAPIDGDALVDTLFDGTTVARTSVFESGLAPVTIERRAIGSDSLLSWLNSEPYDSAAGKAADITAFLEIVRSIDSVVIWRGDTVSARAIAASTWDDQVSVPVNVAPLGTKVFIRQRITTTAGFESDADAGFWHEFATADTVYLKTIRSTLDGATQGEAAALRVAIIPNPARSTAEVRVTAADAAQGFPTMLELGVYDVTGNLVEAMPTTPVPRPGVYAITIDVSRITAGYYSVRARIGGQTMAAPLTVSP